MFENIMKIFKKVTKKEDIASNSKETAKERLHLVLVQDRAHVSVDFLELMKQEIIEVIKKYIEVDESLIDVHLTNHGNEDGTNGAPALYANIPIKNIKEAARKADKTINDKNNKDKEKIISKEEKKENQTEVDQKEEKDIKNNEEIKNDQKQDKKQEQKEEIKNEIKNDEKVVEENIEQEEKESNNLNKLEQTDTQEESEVKSKD